MKIKAENLYMLSSKLSDAALTAHGAFWATGESHAWLKERLVSELEQAARMAGCELVPIKQESEAA